MNTLNPSVRRIPFRGILSLVLAPMGLLLVAWFASGAGSGAIYSRGVIGAAKGLLLFLLGLGLASGIIGVVRREPPLWLSLAGLALTVCVIGAIALFFSRLTT